MVSARVGFALSTGRRRPAAHQPSLATAIRSVAPAFAGSLATQVRHPQSSAVQDSSGHRRQAMREWCLGPGIWQELTSRLPPVPGPFQPVLDHRKRQEASAFVWAHVPQGEPRFAPRPIEAGQPDPVRKDWTGRRGNLWHKLTRPGRLVHYIELRKLLTDYGDGLATGIDNRG
jgi:hypothetical protein